MIVNFVMFGVLIWWFLENQFWLFLNFNFFERHTRGFLVCKHKRFISHPLQMFQPTLKVFVVIFGQNFSLNFDYYHVQNDSNGIM